VPVSWLIDPAFKTLASYPMWPVWLYYHAHIIHQESDFLENVIEYKMRVLIFSTTFV
jgi:hypothetical protein